MQNIKNILDNKGKLYFIGIGGKGLNGIANICIKMGHEVAGSDLKQSDEADKIQARGGKVFYKQVKENINSDIDLVIRTSVVGEDHVEVKEAFRLGIPVIKRSYLLGLLISKYISITVAGSHGKSTTTAITGLALQNAGLDPTIFGGAHINELGSYEKLGLGKFSVAEACEYDRSFHDLIGKYSIITSLEKSHLEYYKDEQEMLESFREFINKHDCDSHIFINGDNFKLRKISAGVKAKVTTYGFNSSNDYVIKNRKFTKTCTIFDIYKGEERVIQKLTINIPGDYNVLNFVSVCALFHELKINKSGIHKMANTFRGVGRRFEISKANEKLTFVDDFCHHPTQVSNLFKGVKQFFPDKKILAVFEPRQFHLIKSFLKEYGKSFKNVDEVIVTDIVPALMDTEEDIKSLTVEDIRESIRRNAGIADVRYAKDYEEVVKSLKDKDGYVVTTIGAGNIYKIRDMFLKYV